MTIAGSALSLRDVLRLETRAAHDRVDALYGACDLSKADHYRRFLLAQAAAWVTLDAVLDTDSKARLTALLADLEALDMLPPEPVARPVFSGADSLGMRYVLEGSRLGSAVLLRDLQAGAPDLARGAGRYLAKSADTANWRILSTSLQIRSRNDASADAIIADARSIFDLFERSWWATTSEMTEK